MKLTASHINKYYHPSKCSLRLTLQEKGVPEAPASPFAEVLATLGQRHEKGHLTQFPVYLDLSEGSLDERFDRTRRAVHGQAPVLYHGLLRASCAINGVSCDIIGEPDYLIWEEHGYAIRDSKLSRRINEKDHPEILLQMSLYGWLYQQCFDIAPVLIQIHSGTGEIIELPYDAGAGAMAALEEIVEHRRMDSEPYTPVGWSKCSGCGFFGYCWPKAEATQDTSFIYGVDQGLAVALRSVGIETASQLIQSFDEQRLSEFKRPYGKTTRKVGAKAGSILLMANAIVSGREIVLQQPDLPQSPSYVMFDLEGLPPYLDETERIYVWGLRVFGENPSDFMAATAGVGPDGDRQGWNAFLEKARSVLGEYGDVPFVHWHHYERQFVDKYIDRFGDGAGVATRVRANLVDLLPITQNAVALPLPSYSLKVVEKYVGFERSQDEYGGDWAIAKYIKATETNDEALRQQVLDQILTYNKEDLEATWTVFQWLKSKSTL